MLNWLIKVRNMKQKNLIKINLNNLSKNRQIEYIIIKIYYYLLFFKSYKKMLFDKFNFFN